MSKVKIGRKSERIHATVPPNIKRWLKETSKKEHKPMSRIIVESVARFRAIKTREEYNDEE